MQMVKDTCTKAHQPNTIGKKILAEKAIAEGQFALCGLVELTESFDLEHVDHWVGRW